MAKLTALEWILRGAFGVSSLAHKTSERSDVPEGPV